MNEFCYYAARDPWKQFSEFLHDEDHRAGLGRAYQHCGQGPETMARESVHHSQRQVSQQWQEDQIEPAVRSSDRQLGDPLTISAHDTQSQGARYIYSIPGEYQS